MVYQTSQNQKFQQHLLITVFFSHQIQLFLMIWPPTFKIDPEFCYISPLSVTISLVQACNVAHISRATSSSSDLPATSPVYTSQTKMPITVG